MKAMRNEELLELLEEEIDHKEAGGIFLYTV